MWKTMKIIFTSITFKILKELIDIKVQGPLSLKKKQNKTLQCLNSFPKVRMKKQKCLYPSTSVFWDICL